jgi:phytoene desaturase
VLEPTPNLDGRVDWTFERDRLRSDLADRVAAHGYEIGAVDVERFVDPLDWERMGMERGTPFALSHRFFQTGPFRPANVDRRVPGLVFVGSGTVPGVSVPMVLVSGRLAAERVEQL